MGYHDPDRHQGPVVVAWAVCAGADRQPSPRPRVQPADQFVGALLGEAELRAGADKGVVAFRGQHIPGVVLLEPDPQVADRPVGLVRGYAAAFAVDGRKAVEKFVEFQYDDPPARLEDGPYRATVQALVQPRRWWQQPEWTGLAVYTFNARLAVEERRRIITRSNDPDLQGLRDQVWK